MKKNIVILIMVVLAGLSACAPAAASNPDAAKTPDVGGQATPTPEIFNPLPEAQKAFEGARALLARELGVDALSITLQDVQAVQWPNSCLGLPLESEMCAQAITPGYLVKVTVDGVVYELHTDQSGEQVRMKP
jgi:hypothetical protein